MKRAWGIAILVLAGCGGSSGGDSITLGAVLSTTGSLANIGSEQLQAATLAIDEINAAGGVLGKPLAIVNKDDTTDPDVGAMRGGELIAAVHPPVVLGAVGSAITLAVADVTSPAMVVQISGSSTSPEITGHSSYLFRTCASDALQGKLLAQRAAAKSFTKVSIIHLPGAYGVGLADAFQAAFTAGGGTVPIVKEYTEGQSSYTSLLTEVYAAGSVDAILLVGYPIDGAQIIKDYNSGFAAKQTFWFFTDALEDPGFVTGVGANNFTFQHEGTGPGTPTGDRYTAFVNGFTSKFGEAPSSGTFSVNVYDAVYLTALAMSAAGKTDGTSVRDHLQAVSAGGTAYGPADWKEASAAAAAGMDVNYEGASGPVDLDGGGDVVAPYDIWNVSGGSIHIVEQSVSPQ